MDGPASVTLTAGKAEVFGFKLAQKRKIIIREGKRLPFAILDTATFELALGKDAATSVVEGNTIPPTWQDAYILLKEIQPKPALAIVVGGVDSGKSSFCTYLANRLASERCRVAVLDEDLGQSDIGPPCTVGYSVLSTPVTDLFTVKPETVLFVGVTSPSGATDKTLQAVETLKNEILKGARADYIIVNTDGWTTGDEAVLFKLSLTNELKPRIAFCLQRREDHEIFCGVFATVLPDLLVLPVEAPSRLLERDKERRKTLRELGFIKHLEGGKVRVFSLGHVAVEGGNKNTSLLPHEAENLIVGLLGPEREFLGIGVIRAVDPYRRTLNVFTQVEEKPAILVMGGVRLDKSLREIQKA